MNNKLYFNDFCDWNIVIKNLNLDLNITKIYAGIDKIGYWVRPIFDFEEI